MPRIEETDVEAANSAVAEAPSPGRAFEVIEAMTARMRERVMDLNFIDVDQVGRGLGGLIAIGAAHGWDWAEREDFAAADGGGPCRLGRFEPHSRRPGECRECRRRRVDHRRP